MELLKKHYEKVLLGIVLLGLVVGAAFLPLMISSERRALEDKASELIKKPVKELEKLDLTRQTALLKRTGEVFGLDFATTHKLVNPMQWQKKADNFLIKVAKGNIGVEAVSVTKISPLYLTLTLDSVQPGDPVQYVIGVERESAISLAARRKKPYYAPLNKKNDVFIIHEVKGPVDNPTEVVLELNDTGERVVLKKDVPFKRVDAHTGDIKYEPEKKSWTGLRVGIAARPPVIIAGEEYNIVAINKNEVVLSAKSNTKKTSRPYNPEQP